MKTLKITATRCGSRFEKRADRDKALGITRKEIKKHMLQLRDHYSKIAGSPFGMGINKEEFVGMIVDCINEKPTEEERHEVEVAEIFRLPTFDQRRTAYREKFPDRVLFT